MLAPGRILGAVHYVDANSRTPVPPYLSWATAAAAIQDAVDVALAGDEVVVTNGLYVTGGRAVYGTMTNRVAVDRPLFVHSVNGAQFTTIQGYQVPGSIHDVGAVRCAYLTNGATLSGFTLTNGANTYWAIEGGGGAFCEDNVSISNCIFCGNSASGPGGGVQGGMLRNCTLRGNIANSGGGTFASTLYGCIVMSNVAYTMGGGAAGGSLNNSTLIGNSGGDGGGVSVGGDSGIQLSVNNCLILGNYAGGRGGGVSGFSVIGSLAVAGSTIVGNTSSDGGGVWMTNGSLNNCIIYYNTAPYGTNLDAAGVDSYCCTIPMPFVSLGVGSITNAPLFVDLAGGNLRLQSNSPCIDAGKNAYVTSLTDLDGHPRIIGSTVDMGAYEFVPSPTMRIALANPNITLAWPLWASNFVPQEARALPITSGGWSNLTATVGQTANENVVTVPPTNAAKFFRLFLP